MGDRPAERAPVADLDVADQRDRGGQDRRLRVARSNRGIDVGGQGPDRGGPAPRSRCGPRARRPADVDQLGRPGQAQRISGRRLWPPARTLAAGAPGEELQRLVEAGRAGVVKAAGITSGPPCRASPARPGRGVRACRCGGSRTALSASMTALATAAVLAIVPVSPTPLTPSGLTGEACPSRRARSAGKDAPGHGVVEHRARQELAVVAVDRALPERLPDALGDPAVELAVDDHRVDLPADVVDGDIAHEIDLARLLVDLDDRDMGAERPGAVRRVVVDGLVEERLHARPAGRSRGRGRRRSPGSSSSSRASP